MRRFSKNSSLSHFSEINLVPLMDLTFVLLIIFVITTPLLEQSIKLDRPSGGELDETPAKPEDVATVEITPQGVFYLEKRPVTLDQLANTLQLQYQTNPKLIIHIRADEKTDYGIVASVVDRCQKMGLTSLSLQTEFEPHTP